MKTETKYDLNWIIEHIDSDWVQENPDTAIELLKYMNSELKNRKEYIQTLRRKELLREVILIDEDQLEIV